MDGTWEQNFQACLWRGVGGENGGRRPIFHMIGANEQCSFNSKGVEDARGSEEGSRGTLVVRGDKLQGSAKRRGLGCVNSLPGSAWL